MHVRFYEAMDLLNRLLTIMKAVLTQVHPECCRYTVEIVCDAKMVVSALSGVLVAQKQRRFEVREILFYFLQTTHPPSCDPLV